MLERNHLRGRTRPPHRCAPADPCSAFGSSARPLVRVTDASGPTAAEFVA